MWLIAVEVVIQVGVTLFAVTQLIVPMIRNTALFPAFRKRADIEEQIIMAREEEAVNRRKEVLDAIRKRSQRDERKNE